MKLNLKGHLFTTNAEFLEVLNNLKGLNSERNDISINTLSKIISVQKELI